MKKFVPEVERHLKKFSKKRSKSDIEFLKGYMNSVVRIEGDLLGLRVPVQRQISKTGFSFSGLPTQKQMQIWNTVWKHTKIFEAKSQALMGMEEIGRRENLSVLWPTIKNWAKDLDNWAHSDSLSSIYSKILETNPPLVWKTLKKWNQSSNAWLRRQSIVSLFYYTRQRKKHPAFAEAIRMVEPLISDSDFYVQRGVGWTLRETYTAYPEKTLKYLHENIERLSSIAFSSATERLEQSVKNQLLERRKKLRVRRR